MHAKIKSTNNKDSVESISLVEEYSPRNSQMMDDNSDRFKCKMPDLKYAEVDVQSIEHAAPDGEA